MKVGEEAWINFSINMNRVRWMIGGIIVILVAAAVYAGNNYHPQATMTDQQLGQSMSPTTTITGTVDDLLLLGRSMTCTFSSASSDKSVSVDGVVHVSKKRVRTEVQATVTDPSQVPLRSHMLQRGGKYYLWNDENPKAGHLIRQTTDQDINAQIASTSVGEPVSADMTRYHCRDASHQPDTFAVPSEVVFMDITDAVYTSGMAPALNTPYRAECGKCQAFESPSARSRCMSILHCQ